MTVFAKPVNRPFEVAPEKTKQFLEHNKGKKYNKQRFMERYNKIKQFESNKKSTLDN